MRDGKILGMMAKQPVAGLVKSRLARETSPPWAARVADAFLRDGADRLAPIEARRFLVYAPAEAHDYFSALAAGRFELHLQAAGDLGRRMADFCQHHLGTGNSRVVLVGADSPTLPLDFIEQAFRALHSADVVLGPAMDGGYYLVGLTGELPPIFDGIRWGEATVLADTLSKLADPAWRLALLPPWYDVDTLADWRLLQGHMRAMRRAGIDPGLPRTEAIEA